MVFEGSLLVFFPEADQLLFVTLRQVPEIDADYEVFFVFALDLLKPFYGAVGPDKVQTLLIGYKHLHLYLRFFGERL